jgi:hypothetical protein
MLLLTRGLAGGIFRMWRPSRSAETASALDVPICPGFRCEHLAFDQKHDIMLWVAKHADGRLDKVVWRASLSQDYAMVMQDRCAGTVSTKRQTVRQ